MIIDQQKKFTTTYLTIKFKEELNQENIGFRALLPNLLKTRTKTYPSRKALQDALKDLYGANLRVKTSKNGLISIVEFSISFINQDFTTEPLFEEAVKLLHEVVYQDNLPKADFEIEKRILIEKIHAFENDKTTYAIQRLFEEMFKEEIYGLRVQGKVTDINHITYKSLNDYYKKMLATNGIDVVVSGNPSKEEKALLTKYFKPNNLQFDIIDYQDKEVKNVNEVVEFDLISQSKVNLGYRLPVRVSDKLYYAATVMNMALGGDVHSKLFMNVREKHSLCYYISSSYDGIKGVMIIFAGIDKDRVDLSLKVIGEQIKDLQTKKLTNDELNLSKQSLINRLKEGEDSQVQSLEVKYNRYLLNNTKTLEEIIASINNVTPEEVLEVAKMLTKDTIYILAPEEK